MVLYLAVADVACLYF